MGKVKDKIMEAMLEDVKAHWQNHYSINFANYLVHDAFGLIAGSQYLGFLFDTHIKLNAKQPFQEYLADTRRRLAVEILKPPTRAKVVFSLIEELRHNGFTKDILYKIFNYLFEPTEGMYEQKPQPFVLNYLKFLNGRYIDNYRSFIYGPDSEQINYIIRELGFKNINPEDTYIGELDKLMWKMQGGKGFNGLQTKKQWLKLIYDKILSYTGDDRDLLFEKGILLKFKDDPNYEELFLNNPRTKKFNTKESRMAIKVYEAAFRLFGHFTVRLFHVGMVEYCMDRSIKIVNRPSLGTFGEILFDIGFIPPTLKSLMHPVDRFIGREGPRYLTAHIFGDFFLRSSFKLPLISFDGSSPSDYMLFFPTGLVPFISGSFESSNIRVLNWEISRIFQNSYLDEFDVYTRGLTYDRPLLARQFLHSQTNLFNRLVELIMKKVTTQYIHSNFPTISKREASGRAFLLISELISTLRRQLFVGELKLSLSRTRKVIETFLQSGELSTSLIFRGVIDPTTNDYFKLQVHRNDFSGVDFKIWGWERLYGADFMIHLIQNNIKNIVPFLSDLIEKFGDNKVKIYPLLLEKESYQPPTSSLNFLPPSGYFEIDLTTKESRKQSLYILTHISFIMLAHEVVFLVKDDQSTLHDDNLIFAFNHYGFIKKEQILFDPDSNLEINNYVSNFYNKFTIHNKEWRSFWKFAVSLGTAYNSQFSKYLESLISGISNYFSLEYLNFIMEILGI